MPSPEPTAGPPAPPDASPPAPSPEPPSVPAEEDGPSGIPSAVMGLWARAPLPTRLAVVALVAVALAAGGWAALREEGAVRRVPADRTAAAAQERAMWDAMRRLSPTPLGPGAPIADALEPGDAERADGRYADYYVHEADSAAFSVLLTSAAFAPDVSVRLPDGRVLAASALSRTDHRAEVTGLQGPGRFEIVATTRDPRVAGAYELAVLRDQPAATIAVGGDGHAARLGGGPLRAGRYEQDVRIEAEIDVPVLVRVASSAFLPRVELFGPHGIVREGASIEYVAVEGGEHEAVVRYLPAFEAPYRLRVSSEAAGARGAFRVEAQTLGARWLRLDGGATSATLGPESWLDAGRYVDGYRFSVPADRRLRVEVASEAFPPAFRLFRLRRRDRSEVADEAVRLGSGAATFEGEVEAGEYLLRVSSGGDDDDQPRGGEYTVELGAEPVVPEVGVPGAFATEVRRVGQSGGNRFEVGVTYVAVSTPNDERTRVQFSVTVRSLDYTGSWAPWDRFARQAYVVDDQGRRYRVSVKESTSPSGPRAEPGTARRGTLVFYLPEVATDQRRFVLVASVGEESVTLPVPVPAE